MTEGRRPALGVDVVDSEYPLDARKTVPNNRSRKPARRAGRAGMEPATLGLMMRRDTSESLALARAFSGRLGWVNNRKLTQGRFPLISRETESVSVQPRCRLGEAWYWVAAGVGGEHLGEVGVERLFPQSAGEGGGEESFDGAFALFGLAAE